MLVVKIIITFCIGVLSRMTLVPIHILFSDEWQIKVRYFTGMAMVIPLIDWIHSSLNGDVKRHRAFIAGFIAASSFGVGNVLASVVTPEDDVIAFADRLKVRMQEVMSRW